MAMTYSTLVSDKQTDGSIRNWVNWDPSPAETILTEAQGFVYSRLRTREMSLFSLSGLSLPTGNSTLAMPDDYIAIKSLDTLTPWKSRVDLLDEEYFIRDFRAVDDTGALYEGQPSVCSIIGDPATAYFDVRADQPYTFTLAYYGRPPDLSETNETNWLTRRYPHLLRAACNYFAFLHKKEQQAAQEQRALAVAFIDDANIEKDMEAQARRFEPYWRS